MTFKSVMLTIAGVGLILIVWTLGVEAGYNEAMGPNDVVTCESGDALEGERWRIDLSQSIFEQNCATHAGFPGKLLCKRAVTIECDIPRGSVVLAWPTDSQ